MSFHRFREWRSGEFVLCFADVAAGGSDNCAAQFMSQKWLDVATVYHANVTGTFMTPLLHEELTRIYQTTGVRPMVAFERNNGGGFEMERLARLNHNGDYRIYTMKSLDPNGRLVDTGKLGWDTNLATRPKMLTEMKEALESELIHLYHRQTVNELFSFIIKPNGRPEAEQGAHDDLVMSLAGVWQLYQTEKPDSNQEGGVVETMPAIGNYKEAGVLYAMNDYE